MINTGNTPKKIKIYCVLVGILSFIILSIGGVFVNTNIVNKEKMRASFTAETTVNQIKSHISRYLGVSEYFRNMIESGHELSSEEFAFSAEMISDDSGIIKAIEMAPNGIVRDIYPLEGNKEAFGIDMLSNPARRYEANLAKESGQYTIAGPYELNQGGLGALLFEPIYIEDSSTHRKFWGFSILVLDWEKFIEELELNKLDDASYCYQIWKKDGSTQKKTIIAEGKQELRKDALSVSCKVPNDTWYVEIVPYTGWLTARLKALTLLLTLIISFLAVIICYQVLHRKYRERLYTAKIEKTAEQARMANEAKTRFLFNMSHDIRTPMNAIAGFCGLLENNLQDEAKSRDYIKKIRISSDILLTIINQVLEMARIESGKVMLNLEPTDIREMVEAIHTVFESSLVKKSLEYQCSLNLHHPYILCDKTKVEEIILNIVSNSVKYTNLHGKISVTINELEYADTGRASYVIIVEDTGIGMSQDYLPHIFEEFSREHTTTETRVAGTGLGLPIVKSLVELMGGTIEVESEVGKGSRFIIHLSFPTISRDEITGKQKRDISGISEKLEGKRILLAEDNDLNAEIAETLLEEMKAEVIRAEDGSMCVDKLKEKPEGYFDMILMDIQMPNINGYTATKMIRGLKDSKAQIPIIAMTANAYEEDRQKAHEAGMNGFIAKPLDVDKMIRVLGEIMKTGE